MTSVDRAKERGRKIKKTAWSGLIVRIVTIGVSLLMVPLSVHYLGKEQYGLWVAVSSLVAMLGFMDGGAGNSIINLVAYSSGAKDDSLNKIISTGFFCLMALALIGSLLFLGIFPFISWGSLLGVPESTSSQDVNSVVLIVGLFFFASMFTSFVGKVERGLQEGNLDNFWNGVGALLSFLFVYIAVRNDTGLIGFTIAFLAGPMAGYLANNVYYLFVYRPHFRPQMRNVDFSVAKNIFAVGGLFFVLQITATVQGQTDNVIISHMLGPAAVTNYAICMKLFLLIPMLFGFIVTPLWPAYREAFASGDMEWVRRVFLRSLRWALLVSIPSAVLLGALGGKIIELWVGQESIPSTALLVGCSIWMIFCTIGGAIAMLFSGLQLIKIQIISAMATVVANVTLSIYLLKLYGVEGVVFASVASWFLFTLIPYAIVARAVLNPKRWSKDG